MIYIRCFAADKSMRSRSFPVHVSNLNHASIISGWRLRKSTDAVKVRASFSPAAPESSKVLVAGATGGTGKAVVELLAAKGIPVHALVRDPSKTKAANRNCNRHRNASNGNGSSTSDSDSVIPLVGSEVVEVVRGDVTQYGSLPPALEGCGAVVCCTGARDAGDPLGPFNVDYQGTLNLIAAAKQRGVRHFVLVSSIGADELLNPINLFWGVLFWKKRAEEELQRSGLTYTIVRPGGLKSKLKQGETAGSIVMEAAGTFGFPPAKKSGSILRSQVAEVCVAALSEPAAANKVVEVVAERGAPVRTLGELFAAVKWY